MRNKQAPSQGAAHRPLVRWTLVAAGTGALLLLAALVGRAVLTIVTLD